MDFLNLFGNKWTNQIDHVIPFLYWFIITYKILRFCLKIMTKGFAKAKTIPF